MIFAPYGCQFCLLKHCYCTAISMPLQLNVMYLAVQMRVSCSIISMLLGKNSDFFQSRIHAYAPCKPIDFFWKPHSP